MPYRTELRRPDLKGTFRCSLCNKIFCHSSSLSRHRMQAHFKSYTCTLCNKEITSNETLRAHMYKKHQISRMFMCRCCNWAFPDKTSLHIHMQAMATGNPGNVSIIAKSSTSPMPGVSMMNGMGSNSSRPPSGAAASTGSNGMPSPLSMTPTSMAGGAGGIFPTLPSRDELINRLRERAMMAGAPNGLDLASFFPNIAAAAAAAKMSGVNPAAALAGLLPPGFLPPAALGMHEDAKPSRHSDGPTPSKKRRSSVPMHLEKPAIPDEDLEDDYPGSMHIDEDEGEEINCEGVEDEDESDDCNGLARHGTECEPNGCSDEHLCNGSPDEKPTVNGISRRSSIAEKHDFSSSGGTVTVNVADACSSETPGNFPGHQNHQDLPVLRSAISASPLNSLLYHKKLNNALRNKTTDPSLMANFFYPNPLQQLQLQMAAAAAQHQQQQQQQLQQQQQMQQSQNLQRRERDTHPQKTASASSTPSQNGTPFRPAVATLVNGNGPNMQLKRESYTPPSAAPPTVNTDQVLPTANSRLNHHEHASPNVSGNGSHISPTDSSGSSTSSSSGGRTSPPISDAAVAGQCTPPVGSSPSSATTGVREQCGQCAVLKGRLALTENRCRFLESKTTSQESKISRLENRIGTLESNGRRYENEAHMLRDHCEQLERKVIDVQENVLRYLQGQNYDQETTRQMLYNILETCRVYKAA